VKEVARLNEPKNKPATPRASLGLARRPFAALARVSLLAVAVAVLGACGAQQGAGDPAPSSESQATEERAAGTTAEDRGETEASTPPTDEELGPPILGDEEAPVTMVEYADYQ
jgi:protein-disulfide isomerase